MQVALYLPRSSWHKPFGVQKNTAQRDTAAVDLFLSLLKPLPPRWDLPREQKTWGTTEGPGRLFLAARLGRMPAAPQGPQDTGDSPAGNPTTSQSYKLRAASCLEAIREGCRSSSPFALPADKDGQLPTQAAPESRRTKFANCSLRFCCLPPRATGCPGKPQRKPHSKIPRRAPLFRSGCNTRTLLFAKMKARCEFTTEFFCPLGGGTRCKNCALRATSQMLFCCCPVFSALITPKVSC